MSDKLEHFDGCYQHSGAALPWDDTCTCGASEIAALQARLAECEREKEQAERNYERARDSVLEAASHLKACRFEAMGMTAERDTLRTQLTETQRLLEVQLAVGDKLEAEMREHRDARAEWFRRATDLEAELAALREVVSEIADGDCYYSDECTPETMRLYCHGKCNICKLRDALGR